MPDIASKPQLLQSPNRRMRIINPYRHDTPIITNGLIIHWPMDEGSGTTVNDDIGSRNGTMKNMAANDWVSSWNGQGYALDFDGADDEVEFADHNDLSFVAMNFTWCCWINPDAIINNRVIFSKYTSTNKEYIVCLGNAGSGKVDVQLYDQSLGGMLSSKSTNADFTANEWQHFAITYDNSKVYTGLKIWRNGSETALTNASSGSFSWLENKAAKAYLGSLGASNQHFDGTIADFRIYNRVLSSSEMQQIADGIG